MVLPQNILNVFLLSVTLIIIKNNSGAKLAET